MLRKKLRGSQSDTSSKYSPIPQQFMVQEFPKPPVIFLHQIACMNLVYSPSCCKDVYSSAIVHVKNQLNFFSTCRLIFPFDDLLSTMNSERHWMIVSHFHPLQFYRTVLYTPPVASLPALASQSLSILKLFPDFLPFLEPSLAILEIQKVSWDKRIKTARTSYVFIQQHSTVWFFSSFLYVWNNTVCSVLLPICISLVGTAAGLVSPPKSLR